MKNVLRQRGKKAEWIPHNQTQKAEVDTPNYDKQEQNNQEETQIKYKNGCKMIKSRNITNKNKVPLGKFLMYFLQDSLRTIWLLCDLTDSC